MTTPTSIIGLLSGGQTKAVKDAYLQTRPRQLQAAMGAISAGTLRSGANPTAVARQYAMQTADSQARAASAQRAALAEASQADAAGGSQLLWGGIGAGANLAAMAMGGPGAQVAAAPGIDGITGALSQATTQALAPQEQGALPPNFTQNYGPASAQPGQMVERDGMNTMPQGLGQLQPQAAPPSPVPPSGSPGNPIMLPGLDFSPPQQAAAPRVAQDGMAGFSPARRQAEGFLDAVWPGGQPMPLPSAPLPAPGVPRRLPRPRGF